MSEFDRDTIVDLYEAESSFRNVSNIVIVIRYWQSWSEGGEKGWASGSGRPRANTEPYDSRLRLLDLKTGWV